MAQWVKVPTTKPEDLSLILGFHMIEGESQPQQVLYVLYAMECMRAPYIHKYSAKFLNISFKSILLYHTH